MHLYAHVFVLYARNPGLLLGLMELCKAVPCVAGDDCGVNILNGNSSHSSPAVVD